MAGDTLYIDCFSGVAGDMFVAALLDLGVGSLDLLKAELSKVDLDGWRISSESVKESGIAATRFRVDIEGEEQESRSFSLIEDLIAGSDLSDKVRSSCLAVFSRVARAEADAHGETLDTVHFHEVGMVDTIIDIVAACILMNELSPAEVISAPVALGSGTVETQHGDMRVPVPAAAILLRGVPVFQGGEECELVTPTGAALVSYFADSYEPLPTVRLGAVGYGAGTRKTKRPNLLRMMLGQRVSAAGVPSGGEEVEQQVLLETNIDDSTPEQLAFLVERLLGAGAADAWLTPVYMKKGRAASILSVLGPPAQVDGLLDLIFTGSSTFGVRVTGVERHCLQRRQETAETPFGSIRVKIGKWKSREVTFSPEYEDCRRAAAEHGVPISEVYAAARAALAD